MKKFTSFSVLLCLLMMLCVLPYSANASWSIQNNAWVSKIKSSLTRLRIGSSFYSNVTNGMVGFWTFNGQDTINGTIADRSGQNNSLYFFAMATSTAYVPGKVGQGLYFDTGIDYLVDGQSSVVHNFGTNPFSVSVWLKTTFAGAGARLVDKRALCIDDNFWEVSIGSGNLIGCVDDGTVSCVSGAVTVNDDAWHHGVFIRNGTSLAVYVDGVLDTTGTANTLANVSNSEPLRIGDSVCNNDYVGNLDEVRLYDRALSASEVKHLYNMGR